MALVEYVVRGLLLGSVYGMLALPMGLAFVTVGTIDFAVGAYALVAAAVAATVAGPVGVLAGLAAALAASGVMGALFTLLRRSGCVDGIVPALMSFGFAVAIASLVLWIWGTQPFLRESFSVFWSLGSLRVSPQGTIDLAIGIVVVAALYAILYRTDLGRMMRAAAVNPRGSELAAIPVGAIQFGTYVAGGLIGGLAGILIMFNSGMDFTAPLGLTLSGFGAAIIFGIGSPVRGLLGGLAMGVAEALASGYTTGMVTAMVPFLFVLLVLSTSSFGEDALVGDRP